MVKNYDKANLVFIPASITISNCVTAAKTSFSLLHNSKLQEALESWLIPSCYTI